MRIQLFHNRWFNITLALLVSALDGYANGRSQRWGDWLATGLFGLYAVYCAQNFLHCREVHCAITAPGFFGAAALMALRLTGAAHYSYGLPWLVFVVAACVGFCIEYIYESRTGTIVLRR
ncbi:MAG: hypothetical protein DLM53_01095 [Candidatus Eremiobacter antarcticus]|nr:MAG: hypothetical protein DLM50_07190 [Candidatus Eremiobacteraeota bacterium]PZR64344.1 MAG: hypothetical protein DLM53_01095 [Candidatus Eremiobacter sp. RRmetagenome_bin22]